MDQEPLTWSERHLDLYALAFKKTYSSRLKQPAQRPGGVSKLLLGKTEESAWRPGRVQLTIRKSCLSKSRQGRYWTITKGLEAAAMIIDRAGHIPILYFQTETANSPLGIELGNLLKSSPNPASTIGKNTWSLTDWQRIWQRLVRRPGEPSSTLNKLRNAQQSYNRRECHDPLWTSSLQTSRIDIKTAFTTHSSGEIKSD